MSADHASAAKALFTICFLLISAVPICGALIKNPSISAALRRTGNLWLNFGLYILIGVLIFWIIDLFFRRHHKKNSGKRGISWKRVTALITVMVLLIAYGMVHVGQIKSRYGVYGVYGNHDVSETLIGGFTATPRAKAYRDPRMAEFLENSNIRMLEDEIVDIGDRNVRLVGRLSGFKAGSGLTKREEASDLIKPDAQKATIVLEHEPNELEKLSEMGVDLVLSGHTHAGQFFPLTLSGPFVWKNYYGIKRFGDMYNIVTSGVGVYGPPVRILTDSEVVQIDWNYTTQEEQ